MITIRIRSAFWFASGVAVALLLVAVFVGVRAGAAVGADETTFVPISPCRLFDTRPGEFNVGPRSTPIGPKESHVQQVTGSNGQCVVPSDATGVALNVTAVAPSAASFLTLYPADVAVPNASNLNFVAGGNPTPNKVDVKLSPTGTIGVYNAAGSVHVLADVVGYYTPKGLADLQAQISTKANAADVYTKAQVDALLATKVSKPSGASSIRISASAFTVTTDTDQGLLWEFAADEWTSQTFAERCLVAHAPLPIGATITKMTVRYFDPTAGTGTAKMYRRVDIGVTSEIASVGLPVNAAVVDAVDSTITAPAIDANTDISVAVCLPPSFSTFRAVTIDFTYPV